MTELEKKKLLEQQGVPQMPTAAAPAQVGDYKPGKNVQYAYQQYLKQLQAQPGAYNSQWQGQMDNLYNQISNRPEFKYDMNADLLYQQMKDQYARSGQLGMMNSMGQASALTGGYANSWAQTAGQQTYDQYMQELNNILPALEDRAYGRYQDEGNQLAQRFGMAGQLNDRDYGMYRDQVGDWQYGTGMALNQYNNERGFDYGAFSDERNYAFQREQFEYQKAMDAAAAAAAQAAAAAASRSGGGGGGKKYSGLTQDNIDLFGQLHPDEWGIQMLAQNKDPNAVHAFVAEMQTFNQNKAVNKLANERNQLWGR